MRTCSTDQLAWWLDDELWEVELAGDVQALGRALTAPRARLVRRVDEWTDAAAEEFVLVCARRARDHAVEALAAAGRTTDAERLAAADDLRAIEGASNDLAREDDDASLLAGLPGDVLLYARDARAASRAAAVAGYVAAFAAGGGEKTAPGYDGRFEAERRWQATWLRERLAL